MKKKIIALALSMVMVFSLAACGSSKNEWKIEAMKGVSENWKNQANFDVLDSEKNAAFFEKNVKLFPSKESAYKSHVDEKLTPEIVSNGIDDNAEKLYTSKMKVISVTTEKVKDTDNEVTLIAGNTGTSMTFLVVFGGNDAKIAENDEVTFTGLPYAILQSKEEFGLFDSNFALTIAASVSK